MPAISDPGTVIVSAAVAAGIQVVPVPGPCAAVAALAAAGLPTDSFHFAGFLPPKSGKRQAALQQVRVVSVLTDSACVGASCVLHLRNVSLCKAPWC